MSTPILTAALLHAHGLTASPADLNEALTDALTRYGSALYPFDEAAGLTEDEVALLREGGLDPDPTERGTADPLLLTVASHAAILERSLGTAEAARRLGVSDARVRQRLTERSLYGVHGARGWRIPAFQFAREGELPGWARVCRQVPQECNPVALFRWLDLPHPDLEEGALSPRQWLLAGRDPEVVAALAPDILPA